jgi:hypothetical protein
VRAANAEVPPVVQRPAEHTRCWELVENVVQLIDVPIAARGLDERLERARSPLERSPRRGHLVLGESCEAIVVVEPVQQGGVHFHRVLSVTQDA